jgi:hypothetical protein
LNILNFKAFDAPGGCRTRVLDDYAFSFEFKAFDASAGCLQSIGAAVRAPDENAQQL